MPKPPNRLFARRAGPALALGMAVFLAFLLAFPGGSSAAREERADLTFIKLEETRKVAGRDVVCEWYTVGEDDVLWKLYHERSRVELGGFHRWMKEVRGLNPQIDDLDLIHPGQKILIPVREAAPGEAAAAAEGPVPRPGSTARRVAKGDTIIGYLKKMGVPYHLIYQEYLRMVKRLNPHIKNLDLIYPGQVVYIPPFEPGKAAKPAPTTAQKAEREPTGRVLAERKPVEMEPEEERRPAPPQSAELGAEKEDEDLPLVEPWRRSLAGTAGEVAERLGGRYVDEGKHYIPLYKQGQITLDARLFPMVEFKGIVRVIIDLKARLPEDLVDTLSGRYRRYQIVTVEPGETVKSILGKVLPLLGRVVPSSPEEPYTVSRSVGLEAVADWVVELEAEPGKAREVAVVSVAALEEEVVDPDLSSYLDSLGIEVLDVLAGGEKGPEVFGGRGGSPDGAVETVDLKKASPAAVAAELLGLLGVTYFARKELELQSEDEAGFSVTVEPDVLFERGGESYILDYGRLSPSIVKILKKNGYILLSLPPDIGPEDNIKEILGFLGYDFRLLVRLASGSKRDGRGVMVTVPGLAFRAGSTATWFVTFLDPHPGLDAFLKSRNLRPIFISRAPGK